MAQKGRFDLVQDNDNTFYPNLNKEIEASEHNEYNDTIIDSKFNLIDDTLENINLSNTDLGDNAEDAILKVYLGTSSSQYLFYLDLTVEVFSGSTITNLVSFVSNNPTINVTESNNNNINNQFTIDFTNTYTANNTINMSGLVSGVFSNPSFSLSFNSSDIGSQYGTSGVYLVRLDFVNGDINYIADL